MLNLFKYERLLVLKLIESEEYRLNSANDCRKERNFDYKDIDNKLEVLKKIKLKILWT